MKTEGNTGTMHNKIDNGVMKKYGEDQGRRTHHETNGYEETNIYRMATIADTKIKMKKTNKKKEKKKKQ